MKKSKAGQDIAGCIPYKEECRGGFRENESRVNSLENDSRWQEEEKKKKNNNITHTKEGESIWNCI